MSETLNILKIRTDGGTQMRAGISTETVDLYAEHMTDGADFPPIVAFYDGSQYWLADGFHRLAAYEKSGAESVPVDVRSGEKLDAVRYALKANATNGRPRTSNDMRRGYQVICVNGLCDKADTKAVQALLNCSSRWAQELTRDARSEAKESRNKRIEELAEQGKSQREIAGEVGVGIGTVNRTVPKTHSSEMEHHSPPEQQDQPQSRGVGVRFAHEAIAVLKRIPSNDGLRQDAFSMVQDWIETNRGN